MICVSVVNIEKRLTRDGDNLRLSDLDNRACLDEEPATQIGHVILRKV